ncbi:helix-turn-helix domain-containing protein [Sediminicola arcticus]|uniref:Helix-turn-helix domain-containing protein n=1 Tax=Sediminicola arcticus TaxID=1574308 RepID=A0ABV2SWC2_9FLAO
MQTIQFVGVTPEQLQNQIAETVKNQLGEFLEHYKPKQPNDYLSRKQVSELLDVDLSTVANWQKSGKLKPLGIGGRVYFLRSDIEKSLISING